MESQDSSAKLVFDIGMHRGLDTKFYLDKGFRVVAVEADPKFIENVRREFASDIESGRLIIEPYAFWHRDGETIDFYVNPIKDDWSSVFRGFAEKAGHIVQQVKVPTVTLQTLFDRHSTPYYIKCDIEGADELFVWQLLRHHERPAFVSVEASSFDVFAVLRAVGYDRFQLVNQAFHPMTEAPNPAREGRHVPVQFNQLMSGLFGLELEPSRWHPLEEVAFDYLSWKQLNIRDQSLGHGWLDLHATTSAVIGR
jgi:FkbM family methyltransferase